MAVGVASLAMGAIQLAAGLAQNANRDTPEQYQETSEMRAARQRAAQMAQSGFTPAEKAAFKQSLAATGNTAYRRGIDLAGGNLAGALRAGINAQQLGAQNQFASQDAALHRQNIGQSNALEQGYQRLENAQVDQQRQVASQQAQAASQSINSGMSNLGSALNLQQALNYNPNPKNPIGGDIANSVIGQQTGGYLGTTGYNNNTGGYGNLGTSTYYGNQNNTFGGGMNGWYDNNGIFHKY